MIVGLPGGGIGVRAVAVDGDREVRGDVDVDVRVATHRLGTRGGREAGEERDAEEREPPASTYAPGAVGRVAHARLPHRTEHSPITASVTYTATDAADWAVCIDAECTAAPVETTDLTVAAFRLHHTNHTAFLDEVTALPL